MTTKKPKTKPAPAKPRIKTKIKVCGLTRIEDALLCEDLGAWAVGFIFAPSTRRVTIEKAKEISQSLKRVEKVGVFVNASIEEIHLAIEQVGLTYVQLHGDESLEFAKNIPSKVIKAFNLHGAEDIARAQAFAENYTLLFDSRRNDDGSRGGTGRVADWSLLKEATTPYILSGGLNAQNVARAIRELTPAVVDVSSGVERQPGVKDDGKLRSFFRQVRDANGS